MPRLTPPFSSGDACLIASGETHQVVWFIDYADNAENASRRVRDVIVRSIEKFAGLGLVFAVRFFPKEGSESAELAARAAIAAHYQDRFSEMHEALFEADPPYDVAFLCRMARNIGLDVARFEADLWSDETTRRLQSDIASAQASSSIPHTPMLFIDGVLFEGAWDDEAIIEAIERPLGVRLELASTAFFRWAASNGLVLIISTVAALAAVNLGWNEGYETLRQTAAGISVGSWSFSLSMEMWINEALMALFFLVVGIEIKRELVDGELSDPKNAAMPLIGALGGMLVPALIFYLATAGTAAVRGWGVPMATDIAFTLGILALLGDRVPTSLKVFVAALSILDDLGAIVVIALFYGHGFHVDAFLAALAVFAVMIALNRGKIYARAPYVFLAVVLWYFLYQSGVHATLAGVLTAAAIPARRAANIEGVAMQARKIFQFEIDSECGKPSTLGVLHLKKLIDRLRDPGFHLQHRLQNWSSFLILPLYAFFNTGILLRGADFQLGEPEVYGTILGLLVGKPLGICLFVVIAIRLRLGRLSSEIDWWQLAGASMLCGIGFTMSILIASAAFEGSQLQAVKLSVLMASLMAAGLGTAMMLCCRKFQTGKDLVGSDHV